MKPPTIPRTVPVLADAPARRRPVSALCPLISALCLLFLSALQLFSPSAFSAAPAFQFDANALSLPPDLKAVKKPVSDKWTLNLLPVGLQRNPKVDYAIFTEMTNAGRKLPEPSFANPVYYLAHSIDQRDVGAIYGNTKDIPYQKLQQTFAIAFASNGYRPCDAEHPPTQVFFFTWGMNNKFDPPGDWSEADVRDALKNCVARARILGGPKFAIEVAQVLTETDYTAAQKSDGTYDGEKVYLVIEAALAAHNFDKFSTDADLADTLCYAVFNDCYYLLVTSLDAETLENYGQRKTLWTTRIVTVSQGLNFEMTLPIMINNASYYFGRETKVPEILLKRAYKRAEVNIGEATVVEYMTAATGTTTVAATTTTAAFTGTTPTAGAVAAPNPAISGTAASAAATGTTGMR